MCGFLAPKMPEVTPLPPLPTMASTAGASDARKNADDVLRRRKGRGQTILTGNGLGDTPAPVERPTLLTGSLGG